MGSDQVMRRQNCSVGVAIFLLEKCGVEFLNRLLLNSGNIGFMHAQMQSTESTVPRSNIGQVVRTIGNGI